MRMRPPSARPLSLKCLSLDRLKLRYVPVSLGKAALTLTRQPFEFVRDEEDALVQTIAERVVHYARVCMRNKKRVSPFEMAAAREGMYFRGGVSHVARVT